MKASIQHVIDRALDGANTRQCDQIETYIQIASLVRILSSLAYLVAYWVKADNGGLEQPDLVLTYAKWSELADFVSRTDHLPLSIPEDLLSDFAEEGFLSLQGMSDQVEWLSGYLGGAEDTLGARYQEVLRSQIDRLVNGIVRDSSTPSTKTQFDSDSEYALDLDHLLDRRDLVEYAVSGVLVLQLQEPGRLGQLRPAEWLQALEDSDAALRKVVGWARSGRWFRPVPSAPPSFWWRQAQRSR